MEKYGNDKNDFLQTQRIRQLIVCNKAKGYGIKTTTYGIKTTSYSIKTTSYAHKTTSYAFNIYKFDSQH